MNLGNLVWRSENKLENRKTNSFLVVTGLIVYEHFNRKINSSAGAHFSILS
jgi:hypothetical protein